MTCWVYVCERIVDKMRREFFYAVLHQDIPWFDAKKFGSLTQQMTKWVSIFKNSELTTDLFCNKYKL